LKKKVLISFSGGKTSAYMAQWIINNYKDCEFLTVFANTGEECEETLEFVQKCNEAFGLNVVWVEASVNYGVRKATSHKVVDFESASRNGEPFEAVIKKYGIPNVSFLHCTREMKLNPILSYAKSVGWYKNYDTAIGIRADEIDRVSPSAKKRRLIYPLISDILTIKSDVISFWDNMPFNLNIKSYEGNCKVCFKKSLRKLMTIAKEHPEWYNNTIKWQDKYWGYIPDSRIGKLEPPVYFYRKNMTADEIIDLSKQDFELAVDDAVTFSHNKINGIDLDVSNGCVESCEVF